MSSPTDEAASNQADPAHEREHATRHPDPTLGESGRRWRENNADALAASNRYVETHGLPLARYRQF